jgi:hypothetical protein
MYPAMIHEGDVDLDPEYQRGRSSTVYAPLFIDFH